ncbi:hypothetical protein LJC74_03090 [Eubacteriales bacterium OttesenSCG-928-A19]|nr:hypothetical protein [Eubacteriales bacterium OttesenSCG-928-A19]
MKKLSLWAISLVLLFTLGGCTGNSEGSNAANEQQTIAGTYYSVFRNEEALTLSEDGTFDYSGDTGKWTSTGTALALSYDDGEKEEWEIDGTYLIPTEYTEVGPAIPEEGLFAGVYEYVGPYNSSTIEFYEDGHVENKNETGEIVNEGTYTRDGRIITIVWPKATNGYLICADGVNSSAVYLKQE